jgi:hypothetical protein
MGGAGHAMVVTVPGAAGHLGDAVDALNRLADRA